MNTARTCLIGALIKQGHFSLGLPRWHSGKNTPTSGDAGLIPGSGRSPGNGNGNPLQYSCLRNPVDRGAWRAAVLGVTRVRHSFAMKPQQNQYIKGEFFKSCRPLICFLLLCNAYEEHSSPHQHLFAISQLPWARSPACSHGSSAQGLTRLKSRCPLAVSSSESSARKVPPPGPW